ncbi:hypothetical protein [Natrinema sp. SYSU A 869]|uniref:hypothetical protein n=1 Tax=Natrinema sp. SYSU A 869 TaxID=2871694 RepID=UPI001CA41D22|nr:hypothetical protein [Natrinema sp. SYSU A 869]
MTSISLEYTRDDAKTLTKAAFERMHDIETYFDDGHRIIGKTGSNFRSYGEKIIVDIPENQSSAAETMITIRAKKEVEMNMTANPEQYKSQFLAELERTRGYPVEHVLKTFDENCQSKEVFHPDEQTNGYDTVKVVLAVIAIFMFISCSRLYSSFHNDEQYQNYWQHCSCHRTPRPSRWSHYAEYNDDYEYQLLRQSDGIRTRVRGINIRNHEYQ